MGDQRVFWKLELELSQEFLEQLINVFPMTHVMDLKSLFQSNRTNLCCYAEARFHDVPRHFHFVILGAANQSDMLQSLLDLHFLAAFCAFPCVK